jgi:predicted dehydrogenase
MIPNRRQFLASTSLAGVAPAIVSRAVLGADTVAPSERINIGVIGCGSRGYNLIDEFLGHPDCQIVAVCDVDKHHYRDRAWGQGTAFGLVPAREKILSAYAKQAGATSNDLPTYADFRELIARDDIDAVVVATPDHWHALCTLQAIVAGKDVYCEKPVTHLFAEGQQVYRAAAQHDTVFQTGSQQRSDARFRRAVEIARNGWLGKIQRVEVGLPPGYDAPQGDATVLKVPQQLDYDLWCGPSPMLPYMRARHHRWWRGHRAYGGGVLMDWIGHHNDIAHWDLNVDQRGPERVEATEWAMPATNIYNTPHHYTIRCAYPGGIESTISSRNQAGLKLIGEDGWVFVNRGVLKASDDRWLEPNFQPGEMMVYRSDNHTRNFLDCVKSRKRCIAPAETAHRSITPGHLAYVSAELGRPLDWDPKTEAVTGDGEANKILQTVSYRAPWKTA